MQSLYTAATGLDAQQKKLGTIANNIANVNTTGFKKSRLNMENLLHQKIRQPGIEVGDSKLPSGLSIGVGVRVQSSQEIHSQGGLRQTDSDLDIAINGDGFFQVVMPSGEVAYTRAGNFGTDGDGNIVSGNGYLVEPQITVPVDAMSVEISQEGVVSVRMQGQVALQQIGELELAKFINPSGLSNNGGNLYLETGSSGAPIVSQPGIDGIGTLLQGQLEISNVNVAEEMVAMIEGQRAYEMASKVVSSSSEMIKHVNDALR